MLQDLAYFLKKAEQCEQVAHDESDELMQKLFSDIAAHWRRIADSKEPTDASHPA